MTFEPTRCPHCDTRLAPAPEAVDRLSRSTPGPLGALKGTIRSKRTTGAVLVVVSCLAAVPTLLGSYVALACAFSGGEFGGKGAFGPAAVALVITAGLCLLGFLPLYFGIRSFKSARRIRECAESWQGCPSCGWAEEAIPVELLEALPSLRLRKR